MDHVVERELQKKRGVPLERGVEMNGVVSLGIKFVSYYRIRRDILNSRPASRKIFPDEY